MLTAFIETAGLIAIAIVILTLINWWGMRP